MLPFSQAHRELLISVGNAGRPYSLRESFSIFKETKELLLLMTHLDDILVPRGRLPIDRIPAEHRKAILRLVNTTEDGSLTPELLPLHERLVATKVPPAERLTLARELADYTNDLIEIEKQLERMRSR